MNEKQKLIQAYIKAFGEGPPIFGMEDEDAQPLIQAALDTGEPMVDPAGDLPDEALI